MLKKPPNSGDTILKFFKPVTDVTFFSEIEETIRKVIPEEQLSIVSPEFFPEFRSYVLLLAFC